MLQPAWSATLLGSSALPPLCWRLLLERCALVVVLRWGFALDALGWEVVSRLALVSGLELGSSDDMAALEFLLVQ